MRRWPPLPLLVAAACTLGPEPAVHVSAAPDRDGVRVCFRRLEPGTAGHPARLEAEGGALEEIVHSPDLLTVSALWRAPRGRLLCTFPYGGTGRFAADGAADERTFTYVLLEQEGRRVTSAVPRGCPVRPSLLLRLELAEGDVPARLTLPGGGAATVPAPRYEIELPLPRDARGVLAAGDHEVVLVTATGEVLSCLVTVDADGTPAAATGYVELGG